MERYHKSIERLWSTEDKNETKRETRCVVFPLPSSNSTESMVTLLYNGVVCTASYFPVFRHMPSCRDTACSDILPAQSDYLICPPVVTSFSLSFPIHFALCNRLIKDVM